MIRIANKEEVVALLSDCRIKSAESANKLSALLMYLLYRDVKIDNIEILEDNEFDYYAGNIDVGGSDHGYLNLINEHITIYGFDLNSYACGFIYDNCYITLELIKPDSNSVGGRNVYCPINGKWRKLDE